MNELTRALASDQEDPLTCQRCEEQLADYIDAEQRGQATHPAFAAVRRHLQLCPHCARAYRELAALIDVAYGEPLPAPDRQPAFDFSFLPAQPGRTAWWDDLGRFIVQFSTDLLASFQPTVLLPATIRVKTETPEAPLFVYTQAQPERDLRLTITVTADPGDAGRCIIVVEAERPSRGGWPNLGGTQVTLKRGGQEVGSEWTDEFGKTLFAGIERTALPELAVEVTLDPGDVGAGASGHS
jgi:hypothetical protein